MISFAAQLREELSTRNAVYAESNGLPYVHSCGGAPAVLYSPYSEGKRHGNFLDASYSAILQHNDWKERLNKPHPQPGSLPKVERRWRELDSCMSSDALLMNVFCHPSVLSDAHVKSMLGVDNDAMPIFGFAARVPLLYGRRDRTEVDMKIGSLLVESKLTETHFQIQDSGVVELYRDLKAVFERGSLPMAEQKCTSYQLIRNVLAAHALGLSFCVLLDHRRPDLKEAWYSIMKCIRIPELRTRCKVLTWQELSNALPSALQEFLELKYGIEPLGSSSVRVASPVC